MVKWSLLILLVLTVVVLVPHHVTADTIFVSGDVSGTWSADTVIVTDEVRVPAGDTLVIQPGVKVLFWVHCKFIVNQDAILRAVGTPTDSIIFDEYWPGNRWHGLRFLASSDRCSLSYCRLTHGWADGDDVSGGALSISTCSPTIANCLIDNCSATYAGGAVFCYLSNASINGNMITTNSAYSYGGGIYCINSSPKITGNTITGNSAWRQYYYAGYGGGIYCGDSIPDISGNTIMENSAGWGGGIYCVGSPRITGNTFVRNTAFYHYGGGVGGGIYCGGNAEVTGNVLDGNSASSNGGGIVLASDADITGNIIKGNSAPEGGGIFCTSNGGISGNAITGNSASYSGGGICCYGTSPHLNDNELSCNSSPGNGGAIFLSSASPVLIGETIAYNDAALGPGIYCTGSSPTIKNAIIWGNDPIQIYLTSGSNAQVTYSDVRQLWPGVGNISSDPLFFDPGCPGDYHLLSSSPCIDAGDPDPIYNDPDGTRADMGCYYFDQLASVPQRPKVPTAITVVLHSAQPNPFSSSTVVKFSLPEPGDVEIKIVDVSGSIVATLADGWRNAGFQEAVFASPGLAPGVYFCHLKAGGQVAASKIVKVK